MRISDWSSDVCSSDLDRALPDRPDLAGVEWTEQRAVPHLELLAIAMVAVPKFNDDEPVARDREPSLDASSSADCVAFVADNHTHGAVVAVCQARFPGFRARDGGSRDALAFPPAGQTPEDRR